MFNNIEIEAMYWFYKIIEKIEKLDYQGPYIFFVTPDHIGDIFRAASLVKTFKETYGKNVVMILPNEKYRFFEKMFSSIDDILVMEYKDIFLKSVIVGPFLSFLNFNFAKVIFAHPRAFENKIPYSLKLPWSQIFKIQLGLPIDADESLPDISYCSNYDPHKIINKKSVLLVPQAKTLKMNDVFTSLLFTILARIFEKEGYTIYINNPGKLEKEYKGLWEGTNYKPIYSPLENLMCLFPHFSFIISVRNGLCDLAIAVNSRIVMLYPEGYSYNLKHIDYFTLKHVKKRAKFAEVEISDEEKYIEREALKIIKAVKKLL